MTYVPQQPQQQPQQVEYIVQPKPCLNSCVVEKPRHRKHWAVVDKSTGGLYGIVYSEDDNTTYTIETVSGLVEPGFPTRQSAFAALVGDV